MKIAAAYDNGKIFQHFGETRYFKVYETDNGTVTGAEIVSAGDASHAALVGFLSALGADAPSKKLGVRGLETRKADRDRLALALFACFFLL